MIKQLRNCFKQYQEIKIVSEKRYVCPLIAPLPIQ